MTEHHDDEDLESIARATAAFLIALDPGPRYWAILLRRITTLIESGAPEPIPPSRRRREPPYSPPIHRDHLHQR